ncbi:MULTISPECIES: TIGR04561 family membrane protein [Mesoplasma]|uniref:Uncharacterized protein n=1 Tax=Mesoplasma florum TaxID=2151 RepID=A0A2R3P5I3_MESFO|nr:MULTISPECIES: TIGR04561 family membrane protein [Mesoplasma]AVN63747.1 hypothetical protein CG006_01985 [Mesoplasma florum]AVN64422.1 hypothetical protein CG003_01935 [Mesoplasma florum]
MKGIFDVNNALVIFGKPIPFLFIFIFFASLLLISLLIYLTKFVVTKVKIDKSSNNLEIEKIKIDEEINSIVKETKLKERENK